MVEVEIFKYNVRKKLSQDYELEFLGDNFDKIVGMLSEAKSEGIYEWIERIIKDEIRPILARKSKQKYKEWYPQELLSFKKDININKTDFRIVFLKVKNAFYIEFHLSHHNYYDKLRRKLNLTQKNY